jgi:hypothetical protein
MAGPTKGEPNRPVKEHFAIQWPRQCHSRASARHLGRTVRAIETRSRAVPYSTRQRSRARCLKPGCEGPLPAIVTIALRDQFTFAKPQTVDRAACIQDADSVWTGHDADHGSTRWPPALVR